MPNEEFDPNAWLTGIGYDGDLVPTLEVLHRLIAAHACTIPYESLEIMLASRRGSIWRRLNCRVMS